MATIKEIAEQAGVSTATVSNVIHGKTKRVSPATIEKVERLIKEMGYVPKMGLRVLNKANSQLIAVVINYHKDFKDSIIGDPFYGKIIGYIEEYVQKYGYYMMLYSTKDIEKVFQMVMGWNIDGVIAISFSKRNCEKIYQLIKKPIVSIDAHGALDEGQENHVINVGLDDESGGYFMTKFLLELGYEHINICASRDSGVDHLRYTGAQRAVNEWGSEKQRLQFVPMGINYEKRKEGYLWFSKRRRPKTVLFFLSDLFAMEAISFLTDQNMRIPFDIGVAGYDDISFAEFSTPSLTTIRQDVRQKAVLAAETLIKRIQNMPSHTGYEIKLPVTLVKRSSVEKQK